MLKKNLNIRELTINKQPTAKKWKKSFFFQADLNNEQHDKCVLNAGFRVLSHYQVDCKIKGPFYKIKFW